jgi:hypothetical protein
MCSEIPVGPEDKHTECLMLAGLEKCSEVLRTTSRPRGHNIQVHRVVRAQQRSKPVCTLQQTVKMCYCWTRRVEEVGAQ